MTGTDCGVVLALLVMAAALAAAPLQGATLMAGAGAYLIGCGLARYVPGMRGEG